MQREVGCSKFAFRSRCHPPTNKQLRIVKYVVRTGLQYCKEKLLSYRIIDTTLSFFTRFYLRESVTRYQPNVLFFTCLIAAIKAENVGELITLDFLFKGAESQLSIGEILRLEATVLSVLKFHLLVLHVGTPLTFLTNEYYLFRRRQQVWETPRNWTPTNSRHSNGTEKTKEELFGEFVGHLQEQCEQLSLRMYGSMLNFLYQPSELAIGIFLHVGTIDFELPNLQDFVLKVQPVSVRSSSGESEKFKERMLLIKNEVFEFVEGDSHFDSNWFAAKFRELKKWKTTVERGGRKKRAGGATSETPISKKAKMDDA
eukprot:Blabericola_migrator_1__2101@NODE_157_length_12604_cov_91_609237_g137_i0_p5_GENE_NODE_157_length_12604_cov_91_609237_g137_i0NODE_157_length_12604_cov_91_609237_g137_i0_p5_ORF_typecomplete_len314_score64_77Cyclin_N/PF00134_23/1_5e11_NODE_157_length_12604_cov_91_609237_g137_i040094950